MELNKIEDNSEKVEQAEWPLTKDEKLLAANLAMSQALLCGMDELKHTKHYKQSLKHKGNQFIDELEKHYTPLNDLVFQINADNKFQEIIAAYEWMVEFMATCDPEKFAEIVERLKKEYE